MTTSSRSDPPTATTTPVALPGISNRAWSWNREPSDWQVADAGVTWTSPAHSDFWRRTDGLPVAHDGSSLLTRIEGDFEFELLVKGSLEDRYDQVGLMIASSLTKWLKAGVEMDGDLWLSAVHTREESDWSREIWSSNEVRLRAARHDDTIEISVGEIYGWRTYRTLFLPGPVGVGPYACSPTSEGVRASATVLALRG